jgi:hypothetical protein
MWLLLSTPKAASYGLSNPARGEELNGKSGLLRNCVATIRKEIRASLYIAKSMLQVAKVRFVRGLVATPPNGMHWSTRMNGAEGRTKVAEYYATLMRESPGIEVERLLGSGI